ncbi:MAG: hypothetical protein Q8K99_08320 [Actinomycetota bacterium]|nr:hypothetical protein [Actinomycetota bacterium]
MGRKKHPNPDIEAALLHAEEHGWRIRPGSARAHAWGKMFCPHNNPDCRCGDFCITSIYGTPRNPTNHASHLRRVVDRCTGVSPEDE